MTTQQTSKTKSTSSVKSHPVAKQLATPMDLNQQEVQAITEAINPLVADALALYVKTKNFHWHLSGSHFRDYHLLFDEQAERIFASVDILTERVRRIGGLTIHSIGQINQLQTINDDNEAFLSAGEMVRRLLADNEHIAHLQRMAHEVCDKNRDIATTSLLEDIIDETERRKWFLFEVFRGVNNTD